MSPKTKVQQNKENPFVSIIINVIVPYYVLTKASDYLGDKGATWALIIALAFPLTYGLYDYYKNKKANYVSVFGVLNTLFTGGFALMQLSGGWFIVKEAAFPFILGAIVFYTTFTKKPFIKFMFNFSQVMNDDLVQQKLEENQNIANHDSLIKKSNILFSASFFLSSLLNFILAFWIFKDIDKSLSEQAFAKELNTQIADMTWMGYVVIALPLMIFVFAIMMKYLKGLQRLTGLKMDEIFPDLYNK